MLAQLRRSLVDGGLPDGPAADHLIEFFCLCLRAHETDTLKEAAQFTGMQKSYVISEARAKEQNARE